MNKILFGAVKPEGELRASMERDMNGCIGHLEELAPTIVCDQKIYGADRLTRVSKQADLGRKPDEHEDKDIQGVDVQYMWWNSESQSNWRDGYVRAGLLLEDEAWRKKVDAYVDTILKTQDDDGYLGIYGEDLRYRHTTENGELWSKSTLYRGLLGYYEATGDQKVLEALKRAFANLMEGYPKGQSNPFCVENSFSGHCHGLTIMDALCEMTAITGDETYEDYAVWLYENYSANHVSEEDMKIESLENPDYFWKDHGVHAYEHLRAVIIAAYRKPEYRHLLDQMLAKLPFYLTPSGGPIGDEWIGGRTANANTTGYEFCSVTELFDSYALLLEKGGDVSLGDKMEWLYYNAGMGMKHPTESSIMYCKNDNCYTANRHHHRGDVYADERYKYSPVHQTTAVCCVPNMGRLTPHYAQNMYHKEKDGFTAVLFGSSRFTYEVDGVPVTVRQVTDYPAHLTVQFEVTAERPVKFAFGIRKPRWATSMQVEEAGREEKNRYVIEKEWSGTQHFTVTFTCDVKVRTDFCKDLFVSYGPLLYALPIDSEEHTILSYDLAPFREVGYESTQPERETWKIHEDDRTSFRHQDAPDENWQHQTITGYFWDGNTTIESTLVPMGGTILRKVTFPMEIGGKKA